MTPDAYPVVVVVAVLVYVASAALGMGFSIYNEIGAYRDLRYLRMLGRNGTVAGVGRWYRKKHLYLLGLTVTEFGLWLLVLTGPAGSDRPTQRGVLFALGLDAISLFAALVVVGSSVSRRAAEGSQRRARAAKEG